MLIHQVEHVLTEYFIEYPGAYICWQLRKKKQSFRQQLSKHKTFNYFAGIMLWATFGFWFCFLFWQLS